MVTQYECDKGHVFIHPAKITTHHSALQKTTFTYSTSAQDTSQIPPPWDIETHVCPICQTLTIREYVEPQPEITSVKSVPLEEVDHYLGRHSSTDDFWKEVQRLLTAPGTEKCCRDIEINDAVDRRVNRR